MNFAIKVGRPTIFQHFLVSTEYIWFDNRGDCFKVVTPTLVGAYIFLLEILAQEYYKALG